MKIRIILSIIMVSTILFLCSCGNNTEKNESTSNNMASETISEQQESAKTTKQNKNTMGQPNADASQPEPTQKAKYTSINSGETISLDFVEITIDGASYEDEMRSDYTHAFFDTEGKKYIYVYGTIKNTSGERFFLSDSSMYTSMTFDDKYNYTADVAGDMYGEIAEDPILNPLESTKFYIISSVPDELIEQYNKMVVNFGFKSNFELFSPTAERCDYLYSITISK